MKPMYAQLDSESLASAVEQCPVAYLPAGIVEWHGEQSACGLDALKAESLCRLAAEHLGGVCLPTWWMSPGGSTPFDPTKYPRGTVTIDRPVYLQAMTELLEQIERLGFKVAVHLSGHYPGVIPDLAETFNARGGLQLISVSEDQVVEGLPAGDHAAAWETSLLMALRPGLVDLSCLPPLPAALNHAGETIPPAWAFLPRCEYYGIYGADPRVYANTYFGQRGVEAVLDGLARKVSEALDDPSYAEAARQRFGTEGQQEAVGKPEGVDSLLPHPEGSFLDKHSEKVSPGDYARLRPGDWFKRFEAAPIVYWPITTSGHDHDGPAAAARSLAERTGGLVFPTFVYAPGAAEQRLAVSGDVLQQILTEGVQALAGMGFRIVTLMPDERVDSSCRERMRAIRSPDDQSRVVVVENEAIPQDAMTTMVPHQPSQRVLDGVWTINDDRQVRALSEVIYGPPDVPRVHDYTFSLAGSSADGPAMIDLGEVENLAELTLNGASVATRHEPPYRFLVTGRLRADDNHLRVVVRHEPQPTLDPFYYRPGPPMLKGPVVLTTW